MAFETLAGAGMGEMAHDDTKDVVMTNWQHKHDIRMQNRSARLSLANSRELNNQMALLAQDARRSSAEDMVYGLKRAGLSPALANGTAFGSVASGGGGSLPAPASSAYAGAKSNFGKLALETLKYQNSERSLMDAQTRDLNATAEGKEIENSNRVATNEAYDKLLRNELQYVVDTAQPNESQYQLAKAILDNFDKFNVGTATAISGTLSLSRQTIEDFVAKGTSMLQRKIQEKQFFDGKYVDVMASLPVAEREKLDKEVAELCSRIALLAVQRTNLDVGTALTEEQINLVKKQISEIGENIGKIRAEARKTHHDDLVAMWEDGQGEGMVIQALPQIIQLIAEVGIFGFLFGRGRAHK